MVIFFYYVLSPIRKIVRTRRPSTTFFNIYVRNSDGIFFCGNNIFSVSSVCTSTEKNLRKYFSLRKGVFVDVGAAIGKYTVMIGKKLGKNGKVISIEPEKNNFEILKKNVKLNKLENVLLVNCACFSTEGYKNFYLDAIGTGAHSFYKDKVVSKKSIKVHIKKLDNILSKLVKSNEKVNFIKIDAEGAEVEVLMGAKRTLKKYHPKMLIEIWDGQRYKQVKNILKPFGYKITKIDKENYFLY
jgi:FkbM family methyltransferase